MAQKYGGDCTLNELRIANAVSVRSLAGEPCSPTLLAQDTGIPKSTVSRSLASLVSKGWLNDRTDPADRRRRIIQLSEIAIQRRSEDLREVINWLSKSDASESAANGHHVSIASLPADARQAG